MPLHWDGTLTPALVGHTFATGSRPYSDVQADHTGEDYAPALVTHTLTVSRDGTGSGTVTSDPVGIDCGATCSADFDHGTPVELSAVADVDSIFTAWSGDGCICTDPCQVVMDQIRLVNATFDLCNVVLQGMTVNGTDYFTACGSMTQGPSVLVAPGAYASFRAATMVVLRNGVSISSGATATFGVDPGLTPSAAPAPPATPAVAQTGKGSGSR